MKLYNTKTRTIEEFIPINKDVVTMYTCGPTVYHYAHIGNLRTYINEDILEKTLEYLGYNVKRAMNVTDVGHLTNDSDDGDDKMVASSIREHKTVMEIADFYTRAFLEDARKLNIKIPEVLIPATSCIDEYINMITNLLKNDYAYISGENVYFDTSKLDNYYTLTNNKETDLLVGVRDTVEEDHNKKNKNDFVLWFTKSKFNNQELKWPSPWGEGYPGWHIECSCIAIKYLGEYLDIHCGGVDNIFPHHTNEIAQSESYLGHKWCNFWVHGEHLNDSTGKMSKSKGDFLTVQLLEQKNYHPLSYRLFALQSHYRNQLVFNYDSLDIAQNTYLKLKNKIKNLENKGELQQNLITKYQQLFKDAISNDLNTASALTVLYDVIKDNELNDNTKLYLINDFDQVLSLDLTKTDELEVDQELLNYINEKINLRNTYKQNKQYQEADLIREELLNKGIMIKDTREGTTFEIIKGSD